MKTQNDIRVGIDATLERIETLVHEALANKNAGSVNVDLLSRDIIREGQYLRYLSNKI